MNRQEPKAASGASLSAVFFDRLHLILPVSAAMVLVPSLVVSSFLLAGSPAAIAVLLLLAMMSGYLIARVASLKPELARLTRRSRPERNELEALIEPRSGWYKEWYFRFRLGEMLRLAGRQGAPVGVIRIKFASQWDDLAEDLLEFTQDLRDVRARLLRQTDLPGALGLFDYAIMLPFEGLEGVRQAVQRLTPEFARFGGRAGFAMFPSDGESTEELMDAATRRLEPPAPPGRRPPEAAA
jgi:hypothetical protein